MPWHKNCQLKVISAVLPMLQLIPLAQSRSRYQIARSNQKRDFSCFLCRVASRTKFFETASRRTGR